MIVTPIGLGIAYAAAPGAVTIEAIKHEPSIEHIFDMSRKNWEEASLPNT